MGDVELAAQTEHEVTYRIRLSAPGAAGYVWSAVRLPRRCRLEEIGAEAGQDRTIGAPLAVTFRLVCGKPPPARIVFRLARPWERLAVRRQPVELPPPSG